MASADFVFQSISFRGWVCGETHHLRGLNFERSDLKNRLLRWQNNSIITFGRLKDAYSTLS